jgi:hypothetical protein
MAEGSSVNTEERVDAGGAATRTPDIAMKSLLLPCKSTADSTPFFLQFLVDGIAFA